LHLREVVRLSGVGTGSVQRELTRLVNAGLVTRERRGSQVHFSANTASPVFGEVYGLIAKTIGIAGVLRSAFRNLEPDTIDVAFIHGSVARGEQRAESDVDVIVVGTAGLRALQPTVQDTAARVGREINVSTYTRHEFTRKLRAGDPFLSRAVEGPRIALFGVDDDVDRMVRESLAPTA
jgi:predicted nucleotidyltransferase